MEKYGFVYIWFDRKHKRYYIGCRWGDEGDGYICSSTWMKQGYRHRPDDFKRKILSRVYSNKKDLLEEEYRWLSKIKKEKLGKKYYNLYNHHFAHWTTDEKKYLSSREKMKLNHRTKKGITNKGIKYKPQKDNSLSKLTGDDRTEAQKQAAIIHAEKIKGIKRAPYPKEHGEKISKARKGKKTGMIPKSAFQKGQAPWNKGLKLKGEILWV